MGEGEEETSVTVCWGVNACVDTLAPWSSVRPGLSSRMPEGEKEGKKEKKFNQYLRPTDVHVGAAL